MGKAVGFWVMVESMEKLRIMPPRFYQISRHRGQNRAFLYSRLRVFTLMRGVKVRIICLNACLA
jgi:hypothetical protein